jgi:hypothetical protein
MGITSRKAETLFRSETLAFAANHKAKSERRGRPRNGKSRARLAFSLPQPSQDRTARHPSDWVAEATA